MRIPKRVTILYPGEMGLAIGNLLSSRGFEVSSYVAERSERTQKNVADGSIILVDSFEEAIGRADLVISLVPPEEAVNMANRFAAAVTGIDRDPPVHYCDANSVSPRTMGEIAQIVSRSGAICLDVAIHGRAHVLTSKGVLLASGPCAESLKPLFGEAVDVRIVGPEPGMASALKMCLGAFSKSLNAVFLEIISAAGSVGAAEEFLAVFSDFYPEVMPILERLLPSYPRHVPRRVQEIKEVEAWCIELGTAHGVIRGTRETLTKLERAALDPNKPWTLNDLLRTIAAAKILPS